MGGVAREEKQVEGGGKLTGDMQERIHEWGHGKEEQVGGW